MPALSRQCHSSPTASSEAAPVLWQLLEDPEAHRDSKAGGSSWRGIAGMPWGNPSVPQQH